MKEINSVEKKQNISIKNFDKKGINKHFHLANLQ